MTTNRQAPPRIYNLAEHARRLRAWLDRCVAARWTGENPGPRPRPHLYLVDAHTVSTDPKDGARSIAGRGGVDP
jgi:hypothetical protein